MKKLLALTGVFLLFLIGVFAVLALAPPTGLAKRLLVAGTKQATGLDVQINGPMSLRLVPGVVLQMENVVVTNPADPGRPVMAARKVDVSSSYASVLGGTRTVERVALVDPMVDLETDKQGRHSWMAVVPDSRGAAPAPGTAAGSGGERSFAVGKIEITGGTVAYRDLRTGMTARLERAHGELRNVTADRLGEAVVKAGAGVFTDPARGTNVEVTGLEATGSALDATRVASLSASGDRLRWRDSTQTAGIEATKFTATAQALGLDGSGPVGFTSAALGWRAPDGTATIASTGLDVKAKSLKGGLLDEVAVKSGSIALVHPTAGKLDVANLAANARAVRLEGMDDVTLKSGMTSFAATGGGMLSASDIAAVAKRLTPSRLEGLLVESGKIGLTQPQRAAGATRNVAPAELQQVSVATTVLAFGAPVDATVAFIHNKERVTGSVKLPTPEALMVETALPATLRLESARGNVDFDGRFETATGSAKGRTRAVTTSVEQLSAWLGAAVPASFKGAVDLSGDIDATGSRVALTNGRIVHGTNAMTGTFAMDLAGARPRISGRIAADKLDADAYLGMAPVVSKPRPTAQQPRPEGAASKPQVVEPEVQLSDVFRTTVRKMLDQPVTRGAKLELPSLSADDLVPAARRSKPQPGFTWSDERIDFSALRNVDLDIDWSVKQLSVRGMQLSVPQLKTTLDGGQLTLDGRELGTKDGKITGQARIDAREAVPSIAATLKGEGVDLYALSEALGITPMIDGDSAFEADVRSRGSSQKQLVEQLSGKVRTNMPQGHVLGYDLGSIGLGTFLSWITGNREYDPERRTPITGLKADLDIEKGVVRDSQVSVGGPLLGVNAEGTIGLVEQRIDYRGRARIASWFSGLPFKIFGDWSRPTFQPDLGIASVFSRSAPGEASIADIVAAADIKPDAELALNIGRVIQKAGPNGLDAATLEFLLELQKRAIGK